MQILPWRTWPKAEEMREGTMRKLIFGGPYEVSQETFTDSAGAEMRLSDFAGKHVLVNFWATWCAPCRKEMPMLAELQSEFGGEDFEVVTIATGRNPQPAIDRFFEEIGVENLPKYLDPRSSLARDMDVLRPAYHTDSGPRRPRDRADAWRCRVELGQRQGDHPGIDQGARRLRSARQQAHDQRFPARRRRIHRNKTDARRNPSATANSRCLIRNMLVLRARRNGVENAGLRPFAVFEFTRLHGHPKTAKRRPLLLIMVNVDTVRT